MNGFPAERSPVLAWNVEPFQAPFPEMAAAAISPVVHPPHDPYATRPCWQGQVDAGTCFPYFGTLYGGSLPSPSYRMQPGCMSNLGQFWPPTPPPDGCGRYEATNNLYFCPPLTPVFRHGESIAQNIRGSYSRLGHYSHLVEIHKDSSLHSHGFKRESPVSPKGTVSYMTVCPSVSKSDSMINACHSDVSQNSAQKQESFSFGKRQRSMQHKLCHCYECSAKNCAKVLVRSVDKENISDTSTLSEQKCSDEKLNSKNCVRSKDDISGVVQRNSAYPTNSSAIRNFNYSANPPAIQMGTPSENLYQSEEFKNIPQNSDSVIERSSSAVHYNFQRADNVPLHNNRCPSNSVFTVVSSGDSTFSSQSVVNTPARSRIPSSMEKLQHGVQMSTPGYDACPCTPTQFHIRSSSQPNEKTCCFSPSYPLSRTLYPNTSESSAHHQEPSRFVVYGNNLNSSPLKNVYFSHIESENVNLASTVDRNHIKSSCEKQEKFSSFNPLVNSIASSSEKKFSCSSFSPSDNFNKVYSLTKNTFPNQYHQRACTVPNLCERNAHPAIYNERQKEVSSCNSVICIDTDPKEISAFPVQLSKIGSVRIKREKTENAGCKFQKSHSKRSSKVLQSQNFSETTDVLNLCTSVDSPKTEPNVAHYKKTHNSASQRWVPSPPRTFSDASQNITTYALGLPTPELDINSAPAKDTKYIVDVPAFNHFEKSHFKIPKAATLQLNGVGSFCPPTLPEISIAQTAPCESVIKTPFHNDYDKSEKMASMPEEMDQDVQILTPRLSSFTSAKATGQQLQGREYEETPPAKGFQQHPCERSRQKDADQNIVDVTILKPNSPSQASQDLEKTVSMSNQDLSPANQLKTDCDLSAIEASRSSTPLKSIHVKCSSGTNSSDISSSKELTVRIKVESECESECGFLIQDIKSELCKDIQSEPMDSTSDSAENETFYDKKMDICVSGNAIKVKEEQDDLFNDKDITESKIHTNKLIKSEESLLHTEPSEYNGLYLLLHSIECISTFEKEHSTNINNAAADVFDDASEVKSENDTIKKQLLPLSKIESSDMHGLNLLCALAEHHFASDIYDHHKNSKNECIPEDTKPSPVISSNYPIIKEENVSASFQETSFPHCSNEDYNSAELQMRTKLAELQKKYKEKQKELARLKSKKIVSNKCTRKNHSRTCKKASHQDSCLSECSSEGSCFHSDATSSPDTRLHAEKKNESTPSDKESSRVDMAQNQSSCVQVKEELKEPGSDNGKRDSNDISDIKSNTSTLSDSSYSSINMDSPLKNSECEPTVKRQLVLRSRCRDIIMTDFKIGKKFRNKSTASNIKTRRAVTQSRISRSCLTNCSTPVNRVTETCNSDSPTTLNVKGIGRTRKLSRNKETKTQVHEIKTDLSPIKSFEPELSDTVQAETFSKASNKRKPDNPKKYTPTKKGRLTETIVTKQLRNRILFETASCISEEDHSQKDNSVPQELFDAMRKCHLGEGSQSYNCVKHDSEMLKTIFSSEDDIPLSLLSKTSTPDKKSTKVTVDHLVQNQRVLAMEDGLFYAGYIKEIRNPDVYGIVRDGQRGNKQHMFTQEDMLTQTILELKPSSMTELNEGTRVCAYWSQPYRYLYPGTVVKAPTPSADWSEPRVFVEFDDGDSGQIPIKNIRLLPADMPCFSGDDDCKHSESYASGFDSEKGSMQLKGYGSERKRKRGRTKIFRKRSRLSKKEHSKKKNTPQRDTQEASPGDNCGNESPASSSQCLEHQCTEMDFQCAESSGEKTKKTLRRQSKRRSELKTKSNLLQLKSKLEKNKKHRKYKDRHKHHHHHHHHHHRHCHRHHHCKKRKHRRRTNCNVTYKDCYENGAIPSTSIPCSNLIAKSTRNSAKEAEDYVKHSGHSKKPKLPQPSTKVATLQPTETNSAVKATARNLMCTANEQCFTSRKVIASSVS